MFRASTLLRGELKQGARYLLTHYVARKVTNTVDLAGGARWTGRVGQPRAKRLALLVLLALGAAGCSEEPSTLRGSVGDGSVIRVAVMLTVANGDVVLTASSDGSTNYEVKLLEDVATPVLVLSSGGRDVVTGASPTFLMLSAVTDGEQATANTSPRTTLMVRAAQCPWANGGESQVGATGYPGALRFWSGAVAESRPHQDRARSGRRGHHDQGQRVAPGDDPLHLRLLARHRGGDAPRRAGHSHRRGLVGGTADGTDTDTKVRVTASTCVVAAEAVGELLHNEMIVNGVDATAALDAAVTVAAPGAPSDPTMADVSLTSEPLERARIATQASITVAPSVELVALDAVIEPPARNTLPAHAAFAMRTGADAVLAAAVRVLLAPTPETTLALANDRVAAAPTASIPTVTSSSTPTTVPPGGQATLTGTA